MLPHGQPWLDTDGRPIQAHGGGVLVHGEAFYWYGENKAGPTRSRGGVGQRVDLIGVSCYRSTDLVRWENLGVVLPAVPDDETHDLHPSKVAERPKVVHNARTGRFVMWLHVDREGYGKAAAGVAVADRPEGPFRYLYSLRPGGGDCRDQTLFIDDDGAAYHVCSTHGNATTRISRLDDEYLRPTGQEAMAFPGRYMEAQAVVKHGGRYWMLASGCTGWDPNPARSAVADSIMGPWAELDNPCRGPDAAITFHAQSTFLLDLSGASGRASDRAAGGVVAMFDRWNRKDLGDSRYVWLPVEFRRDRMVIPWRDAFDPALA
ncbi:MAG: glycoside hydrolase family 43 protein [Planctomycetota bacterium]